MTTARTLRWAGLVTALLLPPSGAAWATPTCEFDTDGDGIVDFELRDADNNGFCEFPTQSTDLHGGTLRFTAATPVEFLGTTLVEAGQIIVDAGAVLFGNPNALRSLTLVATAAGITSDGELDLAVSDDLILVAKRGPINLRGTTALSAKDRVFLDARQGDLTLSPPSLDPAGFTLFGGNRVTLTAKGALGRIRIARTRIGSRRISVDNIANVAKIAGAIIIVGSLLTTDRSDTGLAASPSAITIRGTKGSADPAAAVALAIQNGASIVAGYKVSLTTKKSQDNACLSGGVLVQANGGLGRIDVAYVRDVVLDDGSTTFNGPILGGTKIASGGCPAPALLVRPVLECVSELTPGHLVALFGYESLAAMNVTIPSGTSNAVVDFAPGAAPSVGGADPERQKQPSSFSPGRVVGAFQLDYGDENVAWILGGQVASATAASPRCAGDVTSSVRLMRQRDRLMAALTSVADPDARGLISAHVLNLYTSVKRVLAGQVADATERQMANYVAGLTPEVRAFLGRSALVVDKISTAERQSLLGPLFAPFDPGSGANPPQWNVLNARQANNSNVPPRYRTNFCASDQSDLTVGIESIEGDSPGTFMPDLQDKLPVILGIERMTVQSPHPALISDHAAKRANPNQEGDGYFAGGVETTLPCPCDASQGLRCSGSKCFAYPIVREGEKFTLRGYNFWDIDGPVLRLRPIAGGATVLGQFDGSTTGDPGDPKDCSPAKGKTDNSPANLTHDTLTFIPHAQPGFYELQLFNRNGNFHLRGPGKDASDRTIHVCWLDKDGHPIPPEPTTHLDCDRSLLESTTCAQNGASCSNIWQSPPRPLGQQCGGEAPGAPPVCGETPAFFASESTATVFVQAGTPTFKIELFGQSVEAVEESGLDAGGSDAIKIVAAGFLDENALRGFTSLADFQKHAVVWDAGNFDSGDRKVFANPKTLSVHDSVPLDRPISYGLAIVKGGCAACLSGLVGVAAGIATGGFCLTSDLSLPDCFDKGKGGASEASAFVARILGSDVDSVLGTAAWTASPRNIADRIEVTHDVNFIVNYSLFNSNPGPLPDFINLLAEVRVGQVRKRLMHPFVIEAPFTHVTQPIFGGDCPVPNRPCPPGQMCRVNKCVPPNFQDPTADIGFREQRDVRNGKESHYGVDFLYQKRTCVRSDLAPDRKQAFCTP